MTTKELFNMNQGEMLEAYHTNLKRQNDILKSKNLFLKIIIIILALIILFILFI